MGKHAQKGHLPESIHSLLELEDTVGRSTVDMSSDMDSAGVMIEYLVEGGEREKKREREREGFFSRE